MIRVKYGQKQAVLLGAGRFRPSTTWIGSRKMAKMALGLPPILEFEIGEEVVLGFEVGELGFARLAGNELIVEG
jgi:hypothetical protein